MKAIVQDRYGGPDVLDFRDIDQPVPKDSEVLVQVRAAGLHRGDWHIMTGLPYMIRIAIPTLGLRKPRHWEPSLESAPAPRTPPGIAGMLSLAAVLAR
jgi:NADPH:quinone reductase-like Zn-dependent oxidoreductase